MKLLRESVFWRVLRGHAASGRAPRSYTVTVPASLPAPGAAVPRGQGGDAGRAVVSSSTVAIRRAARA